MLKPLIACLAAATASTSSPGGPTQDTICPADKSTYLVTYGAYDRGDATLLCNSDDEYLVIKQKLQVAPTLPFIRLETWAYTDMVDITELTYNFEGRITAIVPGGQNANTWRTYIYDYVAGSFSPSIDERGTDPFVDDSFSHPVTAGAADHVGSDGEIRIRMDAFSPGTAVNAQWRLFLDLFTVDVTGTRP